MSSNFNLRSSESTIVADDYWLIGHYQIRPFHLEEIQRDQNYLFLIDYERNWGLSSKMAPIYLNNWHSSLFQKLRHLDCHLSRVFHLPSVSSIHWCSHSCMKSPLSNALDNYSQWRTHLNWDRCLYCSNFLRSFVWLVNNLIKYMLQINRY